MRMVTSDDTEFSLDTWLAFLAGSQPWATGEARNRAWTRLLTALQLFIIATTAGTLWWARQIHVAEPGSAVAIGTGALALLSVQPISRLWSRVPWPRGMVPNVVIRTGLVAVVCFSVVAMLPGWKALWTAPFAVAVGIDNSLTCMELGWQPRHVRWYWNFVRSTFHLGVVGTLIGMVAVGSGSRLRVVLPLYVSLHVWTLIATCTTWALSVLARSDDAERADAIADVIEAERRQRAHWLHDDVCAQLRLVSLKVQTHAATQDEVVALLDDFDHQLRLRQLDELCGSGRAKVAEVLQPYIRHAQNQGVTIEEVPGFEDAAAILSEQSARLTARAASVLTSNALNAGSTAISYRLHSNGGYLVLTVADNGPGFRLADVPYGRGLSSLIDDLRPGGIEVATATNGGACVTATIPFTQRTRRGEHPPR